MSCFSGTIKEEKCILGVAVNLAAKLTVRCLRECVNTNAQLSFDSVFILENLFSMRTVIDDGDSGSKIMTNLITFILVQGQWWRECRCP